MRNISTRMDAVLKRNLWYHAKMAVGALIRRDSISKDSCNITMCEGEEGGGEGGIAVTRSNSNGMAYNLTSEAELAREKLV